jgi:DNA mismatch repair protein MutL
MQIKERRVQLLEATTVNRIAAGEVVERPAAALKELVENALDAGAAQIEIELAKSGRKRILVRDDGCGMDEEDARACLQRHATSKIRSAEDLSRVETLGFRGEALAAIGSVARLTVRTSERDGSRIVVGAEFGRMFGPDADAGRKGTEVEVEDLFASTPARLKFLKTDATELANCLEAVSKTALAHPGVRFRLRHEGQVLLETSGSGDTKTTLGEIWGRETARGLVPVDYYADGVRVRGLVSPPHFTKPTRSHQWLFANGRPIKSRSLTASLDTAFRDLTPERRYPLAALMIMVDPAEVDVNVSPTKSEVKFRQERAVFDALRRGVKASLLENGMMPSAEGVAAANEALRGTRPSAPVSSTFSFTLAREGDLSHGGHSGHFGGSSLALTELTSPEVNGAEGRAEVPEQEHEAEPLPRDLSQVRVLDQVFETFILCADERGLLVVDQHEAHERVLFEHLRDTRGAGPVETQRLLSPETLELDARSARVLAERVAEFRALGFEIEAFGGGGFLVRAVPAAFRLKRPLAVLRDLVDEIANVPERAATRTTREDVLVISACKMAVKAGDSLGRAEMERLLEDLSRTENPYVCPHGYPIVLRIGRDDLLKRFRRKPAGRN